MTTKTKRKRRKRGRITEHERALRRARQRRHYARARARIHAYLGGECEDCGRREPEVFLEVDHVHPSDKVCEVLRSWSRRWDAQKLELDKCVLRCHADHSSRTAQQRRGKLVPDEAPPF